VLSREILTTAGRDDRTLPMKFARKSNHPFHVALLALATLPLACRSSQQPSTYPVRLVDRFAEASVSGTPAPENVDYQPTLWRFDDAETSPFRAVQGIADLHVEDGVLRGRTTSSRPILVAERGGDVPDDEPLYAVEVRGRVSAGARMSVYFDHGPTLVVARALGTDFEFLTTPIPAGDEVRTYVMRAIWARGASTIDRILLVPTDVPGAEFEIESVRLIFRRERLDSIPSGVGWHGMSEIYRESIVSRSPESVRFHLTLPAEPRLDLAMATIEANPVTFRMDVQPSTGEARTKTVSVTEPEEWHETSLDLTELAGEEVELSLSLDADTPGALGFWGAPVVHSKVVADEPRPSPRGVILVITDTLREDHLQFYGYERETAPNLARVGDEGVRISDAISQATTTRISVPSIQTSLYPTTHTVLKLGDRLPAAADTIAEAFRKGGYTTMGVASIPFVGRFTNLHQGYEVYYEYAALGMRFDTSPEAVDEVNAWVENHVDVPFFVLLHVSDPHPPFRPLKNYETAFAAPGDMDRLDELLAKVKPHIAPGARRFFGMPTRKELATAGVDPEEFVRLEESGYDGSIKGMDDAFGRLFAKLDELGLREKVVVAVVSDHGTELLEHGRHFHGHSTYGELNRVPMLLWGPGFVPARGTVGSTVQTIDVMPTLLELAGLPAPKMAQGRSLVPLFAEQPRLPSRPAVTEATNDQGTKITSLISDGWKLIRLDRSVPSPGTRYELYDHVKDPLNFDNVADDHPEIVDRLAEQIEAWRKFAIAAKLDDAKATEEMDSEELERLRSLGYVE
jgi:choline-sulfatase